MITDREIRLTIINSVRTTFEVMLKTDVGMGKSLASTQKIKSVDVSGIMSFMNSENPVTFVLGFQKATIFSILEQMYQREFTEVNDSVREGVGELTNIIYGQIKSQLNSMGLKMSMSLPTIILGQNHLVVSNHKQQFVFLFEFKGNEFYVYFGN